MRRPMFELFSRKKPDNWNANKTAAVARFRKKAWVVTDPVCPAPAFPLKMLVMLGADMACEHVASDSYESRYRIRRVVVVCRLPP